MSYINYLVNPEDFVEENEIGKGNFGIVSLVHKKNDKKYKIACKKIPVNLKDPDVQKNFMREVTIMANLKYPNLVELVGFSLPSQNDQFFKIYSKYIPNKNLLETLNDDMFNGKNEKILNPTRLSIIVYGIAFAMANLHRNRIVHRDLKPENVFLDENYRPILADFGLSKIYNEDVTLTNRLGTPYFMAPELFCDDDDKETLEKITNKIDVYAFSITLLTLFTLKYRFEGRQPRSINQLVNKIISGKRYVIPSDVPAFYVSLIKRCWSNNINERPSFEDIVKELEKSDDFIFDCADKKEVYKYMKQLRNFDDINKKNVESCYSSSSSSINEEEDIKEEDNKYEETQEFDFLK